MNKKILTLLTVSIIATGVHASKAEASVFTDLTDNKIDQTEKVVEDKKLLINSLSKATQSVKNSLSEIQSETTKVDKDKADAIAQKDQISKEIESMKEQLKQVEAKKAEEQIANDAKAEATKKASEPVMTTPADSKVNSSVSVDNGNKVVASGLSRDQRTSVLTELQNRTGVPASQWDYIISRESGWDPTIRNSLGYYGLFQLAPGYKGNGGDIAAQIEGAIYLYKNGGMAHWAL